VVPFFLKVLLLREREIKSEAGNGCDACTGSACNEKERNIEGT
jgi:hypothetical protein